MHVMPLEEALYLAISPIQTTSRPLKSNMTTIGKASFSSDHKMLPQFGKYSPVLPYFRARLGTNMPIHVLIPRTSRTG